MTPLRKVYCGCFLCSDGGRRGPKHVSCSTLYAHSQPDNCRRLGSLDEGGRQAEDRVGGSVEASAEAGMEEGAAAGARAEAVAGVAADAKAATRAGVALQEKGRDIPSFLAPNPESAGLSVGNGLETAIYTGFRGMKWAVSGNSRLDPNREVVADPQRWVHRPPHPGPSPVLRHPLLGPVGEGHNHCSISP